MGAINSILNYPSLIGDEAVMPLSVLTNSATVNTDGSFTPSASPAPGVTRWVDMRDGIPSCYPSLTFSMRPPVRQSPVYRIHAKLVYPVPESDLGPASNGVTPGPMKAYELAYQLDIQIPERSTLEDRRKGFSLLVGLLVKKLKCSDLSPDSSTGSPIPSAALTLESVWGA